MRHILQFFYFIVDWSMRKDPECHSSAKRARVCATFTDTQEVSIVEFVKQHPELYDKEHPRFHYRTRRETLWAEIAAELYLQPFNSNSNSTFIVLNLCQSDRL